MICKTRGPTRPYRDPNRPYRDFKVRPYRDSNVLQKREDFVQSTYHHCCFLPNESGKNFTTAASIADQLLPIIMAAPTVGQQKLHNTINASIVGQPLTIIQHNIMPVFIANEEKNYNIAASTADQQLHIIMAVPTVGKQNYTTLLLPPLLASH